MAFPIDSPLPVFYDRNGTVLDAGYVYIGTPNLNPITNPIAVYWDAAQTIPAPQPLRTVRGYIARNGAPADVYVTGDYSILVRDRNQQLVLNEPISSASLLLDYSVDRSVGTIALLRAMPAPQSAPGRTFSVTVLEHTAGIGKGGGAFRWDSASLLADDNGRTINPTGNVGAGRWIRIDPRVTVEQYGAVGNGRSYPTVTDDTVAFTNAMAFANTTGDKTVHLDDAGYFISSITVPAGVELRGNNSMAPNHSGGLIRGSHLVITQSASSAVTLGNSSKLKGLAFWYPDQNVLSTSPTPIVYPVTISAVVRGVQIDDVWCSGAYDFIQIRDLATLNRIGGYPLRRGIDVSTVSPDTCRINDVHFNPNYLVAASAIPREFYSYCGENLESSILRIASADGLMASNIFGYCYTYGLDTDTGSGATLPSCQITNFGFDVVKVGFNMGGNSSNFGISAANGYVTPILGTDRAATAAVWLRGNCTGSNIRITNMNVYGTGDSNVINSGRSESHIRASSGCFQNTLIISNSTFRHHTLQPYNLANAQECRILIDGQVVPQTVSGSPATFRQFVKNRVETIEGFATFLPTLSVAGFGNNDNARVPSYTINGATTNYTVTNPGMQVVIISATDWSVLFTGSYDTTADGGVAFTAFLTTNLTVNRIALIATRNFTSITNVPSQTTLAATYGLFKVIQADNPFTIATNDSYAAIILNSSSGLYSKELRGSVTQRAANVRSILNVSRIIDLERFS